MKNRMTLSGAFLLMLGIATGLIGLSVGGGRALAAQHEVDIDNLAFAPAAITVNVGDSVRWVNSDNVTHTVTSDSSFWASGNISTGSSYTFTFSIAGTYPYHCEIHPSMTGSVTVVGPTNTPTQINTPTLTATPTKTNTPTVLATVSTWTPTSTATTQSTQTPTATATFTRTATPTVKIQDTQTPTNTPLPPTVTNTPSPTVAAATTAATATPTRSVPLPPNTGSGSSGPGSLPFMATALVLVVSGLGLATVSMRRR